MALLSIFFAVAAFLGILLFSLLVFREENRSHSGSILGIFALCFALFSLHNLLLAERAIYQVPFLYRITKPMIYAVPAIVYLYVRANVYSEMRFRRYDWLLFLPAILHAAELLPFFIMPRADKIHVLDQFYSNMNTGLEHNEGILPRYLHPVLICMYASILYVLCGRMLSEARRRSRDRLEDPRNRNLMRWLRFFLLVNILLLVVLVVHSLTYRIFPINTYLVNNFEAAFILFSIALALFFQPAILYGFKGEALVRDEIKEELHEDPKVIHMPEKKRLLYLESIRRHFDQNQPFLKPGYSIKQLSEETSIPYSYLSQVINQEYGMNFNELVNSFRVEYVKKLMQGKDAHNYTLEALAEMSGFSSRATFSRAFNRFAGCTPSDYFRKLAS